MGNPFESTQIAVSTTKPSATSLLDVSATREMAEVQASIVVAKKFPRNELECADRILIACQRPTLAETAIYAYSRGGSEISGPSIRLAEAIAQNWQNIQYGIRELDQRNGESTVEAYAWDLQTNTRQSKVFQVRHIRHTRKGRYDLEDPRDIYELVANQGARRLRACILGIIPGDVVEAAVKQCEETLRSSADTSPESIRKMVDAFATFGVSKEQVERRIQRRLESITPAQVIVLRKIYNSLKDGRSAPADWFEQVNEMPGEIDSAADGEQQQAKSKGSDGLKGALKRSRAPQPVAAPIEQPTEYAPGPCPEGGPMSGDTPTKEVCDSCPMRAGCPTWEA